MKLNKLIQTTLITLAILSTIFCSNVLAQYVATHTRGKLWETLENFGFIGSSDTWNYEELTGVGFYPGFSGYSFPNNEELVYIWPKVTANFHNFRSGPWIIVKDANTLVPPDYHPEPREFLLFHSSMAGGNNGLLYSNPPFVRTENYVGSPDFNPLLPEEINENWFPTATGITVTQRSMTWSYPDYDDFIIYDYVFKNTGDMAIPALNKTINYQQTLNEVWIVFHSGIQVSTKGFLNFHWDDEFFPSAAPAGGFGGWRSTKYNPSGFTDYYGIENDGTDGKGVLYYSYDFNGGREPVPWDDYKIRADWQSFVRIKADWLPELQDPSCFGFMFLYRTPPIGADPNPFEADPDFLNIYSDERETFSNKLFDFENFGPGMFTNKQLYDFIRHSKLPPNDGKQFCWTTSSFGPYKLAPGDSVHLIVAEIAGVMDLKQVAMGDPNHWFPDSSLAAIRRNAENARNVMKWGFGARVGNINLAGDAPESPPAPNCEVSTISMGTDTAIISVRWDRLAEETVITDGSEGVFYDGSVDLDGYRIFRTIDRTGVWWDFIIDIPISEINNYWNQDKEMYEYLDKDLNFGDEFRYYVQAYNKNPREWTSANGTVVSDLGELVSDDYNQTNFINARPGPEDLIKGWDVFVAPNPYVEGDPKRSFEGPNPRKIEFRKLPERATIKIFSISGDLIKTIEHGPDQYGNLFGSTTWDQRSDAGLLVAPGLYIYVIESSTAGFEGWRSSGKLMIIR